MTKKFLTIAISGRPGEGKTVMMGKIEQLCIHYGWAIESRKVEADNVELMTISKKGNARP